METMQSNNNNKIVYKVLSFLKVYKDGRACFKKKKKDGIAERLLISKLVIPPSLDSNLNVLSKDILLVPQTGVSARLYLPKITRKNQKFPVLVYYHGGAFCFETPFSRFHHNFLSSLVLKAKVVAVSVDYRRVPEHYLPLAYDDSWDALKWVSSHSTGQGPETWLNDHGDYSRVFLAGDGAGANIVHNMSIRAAEVATELLSIDILGIVLLHPYFWVSDPMDSETKDMDKEKVDHLLPITGHMTRVYKDRLLNPIDDPNLSKLGCKRVLVCVAERDIFRDRGRLYYDTLEKSGWNGVLDICESKGEDHGFHLFHPHSVKAPELIKRLTSFLN